MTRFARIIGWFAVAGAGAIGIASAALGSPGWSFAWASIAMLQLWQLLAPEESS